MSNISTVIIVGVVEGVHTPTGHGTQMFKSWDAALKAFPGLDRAKATKRFAKPVLLHEGRMLWIETKKARRLRGPESMAGMASK